jgi:hypothetical protein
MGPGIVSGMGSGKGLGNGPGRWIGGPGGCGCGMGFGWGRGLTEAMEIAPGAKKYWKNGGVEQVLRHP